LFRLGGDTDHYEAPGQRRRLRDKIFEFREVTGSIQARYSDPHLKSRGRAIPGQFEFFGQIFDQGWGEALSIKPARRSSLYTVFREMDKLCAALEMFPPF
jgi:hypothetical protein